MEYFRLKQYLDVWIKLHIETPSLRGVLEGSTIPLSHHMSLVATERTPVGLSSGVAQDRILEF